MSLQQTCPPRTLPRLVSTAPCRRSLGTTSPSTARGSKSGSRRRLLHSTSPCAICAHTTHAPQRRRPPTHARAHAPQHNADGQPGTHAGTHAHKRCAHRWHGTAGLDWAGVAAVVAHAAARRLRAAALVQAPVPVRGSPARSPAQPRVSPVPVQIWEGEASPGADVTGVGEASPGADVGGVGEASPSAHVGKV